MVILALVISIATSSLPIRSITIVGDSLVNEKELRSAMLLRETRWFRKTKFHLEILNGDVDAIRSVYLSHGFLEPSITSEYAVDSTGLVDIKIVVSEGKQTMVQSVSFAGNSLLDDYRLKSMVRAKPGLPFNPFALENDYLSIINEYDSKGYHDAGVTAKVELVEGAHITYQISEGDRIHISEVVMEGVPSVSKGRLKTAIGLPAGIMLTNAAIAGGRKRLHDLDIFSRIRVREEGSSAYRKLVFQLDPKEPIIVGLRVGYSTLDGPKTNLTIRHNNLFHSLRRGVATGKLSLRERSVEFSYTDPITLGRWFENGFGARMERRREIGYRTDRYGGYATVMPRPFLLRYDLEKVRVYDVEIEGAVQETSEWLRTFTVGLTVDRRDDPIRPQRGAFFSNYVAFAGILPEAKSNFISNESRFRRFSPWIGSTLGLRFDLGLAEPFSPTKKIPLHSRFFLGGGTTVRGYGERAIGPKDSGGHPLGGEYYLLSSVEIRRQTFWRLFGAFFIDVGALGEEIGTGEISPKVGTGVGLRVHTAIGPIRLDYGRNLEGSGAVHFAVGEAF